MYDELESYVKSRQRLIRKGESAIGFEDRKKLTIAGFKGHYTHLIKNELQKIDITRDIELTAQNLGYSLKELASIYNLNIDELLNQDNWKNNVFTTSSGIAYMFKFTYTGNVFERID